MNRANAIKVLTILKQAYVGFYKDFTKEDAEGVINIYQSMFDDNDIDLIAMAVKELVGTLKYPPTIADIKDKMDFITHRGDKTPTELWSEAKRAIQMPWDEMTDENFKKLSPEVQAFFVTPHGLKEIAMLPSDVVNSVTQSNFLKQIQIIQKRQRDDRRMLPETKAKLEELYSSSFKQLGS